MLQAFQITKTGLIISIFLGIAIALTSIYLGDKVVTKQKDKSLTGLLYLWKKSPILTILLTILIGPFFEEVLFRFIGITFLNFWLPTFFSVIVTSIAFGLAHNQFPLNVISGLMGVILAIIYLNYGVIASFITHGLQNGLVLVNLYHTVYKKTGMTITQALEVYKIKELVSVIDN
ncbi:MAG: CPBP family intramembrane glutamic endopeptidase [Clostridia bacterium]